VTQLVLEGSMTHLNLRGPFRHIYLLVPKLCYCAAVVSYYEHAQVYISIVYLMDWNQ